MNKDYWSRIQVQRSIDGKTPCAYLNFLWPYGNSTQHSGNKCAKYARTATGVCKKRIHHQNRWWLHSMFSYFEYPLFARGSSSAKQKKWELIKKTLTGTSNQGFFKSFPAQILQRATGRCSFILPSPTQRTAFLVHCHFINCGKTNQHIYNLCEQWIHPSKQTSNFPAKNRVQEPINTTDNKEKKGNGMKIFHRDYYYCLIYCIDVSTPLSISFKYTK